MTTANWKTTIGGALGTLGTSLVGIGVVPQLGGTPSKFLTYTAITGFLLSCFGKFFTALFAADAATLTSLSNTVAMHETAIRTGDTSFLTKPQPPIEPPKP